MLYNTAVPEKVNFGVKEKSDVSASVATANSEVGMATSFATQRDFYFSLFIKLVGAMNLHSFSSLHHFLAPHTETILLRWPTHPTEAS